jgi:hypothetical protein
MPVKNWSTFATNTRCKVRQGGNGGAGNSQRMGILWVTIMSEDFDDYCID